MEIPYKAQKIALTKGQPPQEDKTWKPRTGVIKADSKERAIRQLKLGKLNPIEDKNLAIRSVHSGPPGILIYYVTAVPTVKKDKPKPRRRAPRT